MSVIDVNLADRSYPIVIEPGSLSRLGAIVQERAPHRRAMIVADEALAQTWLPKARNALERAGIEPAIHTMAARESAKAMATVDAIHEAMLAASHERTAPLIALGGGIVGDTAGFAAATYMRGVSLLHVPTTLLAMVDAAIGGKTGVNKALPDGGLGKNLIGVFWQPRAVVCDPEVLSTLDARDLRCGMAECIKHGMIAGAGLLNQIESSWQAIAAGEPAALRDLIDRSVRVKVRIVEADEREAGQRMLLNLGHTFAHVIESVEGWDIRHGEAVAIGLCAATEAAARLGRVEPEMARSIRQLLERIGLPTTLPGAADASRLIRLMQHDKKVRDGRLQLVIPTASGRAEIIDDVPIDVLRAAWESAGARNDEDQACAQ